MECSNLLFQFLVDILSAANEAHRTQAQPVRVNCLTNGKREREGSHTTTIMSNEFTCVHVRVHVTNARAYLVRRLIECRMIRQPQIVVGTKVQHWHCRFAHTNLGVLGRGDHAFALECSRRIDTVQLLLQNVLPRRLDARGHVSTATHTCNR
jgi:hypothetical protein